jgi:hypothetical protein
MPGESKRGGARPGAGRKPGIRLPRTIKKEEARDALRQIVLQQMQDLVAAQLANATGLKYLVTRDKKSGKFVRVTEAMAKKRLGDNEFEVEVWEKDPNVAAFTDLMNRALDKPTEAVSHEHTGTVTFKWKG